LRLAEVGEALRVAAIDAALGDDIIDGDVPRLRMDALEARELVGDADRHRLLREAGERAVEVAAAVAEPVALRIPSVHRQQDCVGKHLRRRNGKRNVQRPPGESDPGMPFAEHQWRAGRDDGGQSCQRALFAQRSGEVARVILVLHWPAESDAAANQPRERARDKTVDALAPELELPRRERKARGEPWLEYWRLSLRLEDMPPAEVRGFLSKFERTYVAELLREEWLKVLGKRGDWQEFDRQAAFYGRDDLEVRCYGWASRLARGDES